MAQASEEKPTRVKVREHRGRLRAASFRSEAHRQSLAVAMSAHADEDQGFIDAVWDWEAEGAEPVSGSRCP